MRAIRMVGAFLVCVVATVFFVLAVVLSITLVLLPVGLAVGYLAIRLYKISVHLALPRPKDFTKGPKRQVRGLRKGADRRVRSLRKGADQQVRSLGKGVRKKTRRGMKRIRKIDLVAMPGR